MNSKRKNRLVTLLTIMAVAVCSVFGSPIQAKAAASDIAVLDQLSAQAQYPVVMNLGAYDEATGGVLNALATQAFASWASDNYINYEYISIDEMYIAPFSSTLAYAEMTVPFTSLLTEVAASEDGDTLIAAMQYALMIHYSYISSANEAVSKIVYGFLSASDGTYIGFAGTDEDTTNMAYLAMYSLFYSGQPILYSTDISLDDGLDVISEDTSSRQADTSAQASNNSSSTAMCWLSATGSKYHSINNCGRMNPNNARQVTIAEAERQGYGRCKKCW
jgi:metallo beta-lactamase